MSLYLSEADAAALLGTKAPKRSKYGAKPAIVDGIRFDSHAEARRYSTLKVLEQADRIRELELQPRFVLHGVDGSTVGRFTADFRYRDVETNTVVVEEFKGFRTRDYILRKKLAEAEYGITIREVRA